MKMLEKVKNSIHTFIGEYRQVRWPSLRTVINLTLFVILVSGIITLIIIGLDGVFFELRSRFVIK
ncbi:MAG: preprotein translocase subunit SecE [Candidatus Dojkabacteria bacterium]|nr:preprotein translocase subunit SecE [Candidatus Dojkabacteria bacterium]